jgi:hypothetical protein
MQFEAVPGFRVSLGVLLETTVTSCWQQSYGVFSGAPSLRRHEPEFPGRPSAGKKWFVKCESANREYNSEVLVLVPVATNTGHWKNFVFGKAAGFVSSMTPD